MASLIPHPQWGMCIKYKGFLPSQKRSVKEREMATRFVLLWALALSQASRSGEAEKRYIADFIDI